MAAIATMPDRIQTLDLAVTVREEARTPLAGLRETDDGELYELARAAVETGAADADLAAALDAHRGRLRGEEATFGGLWDALKAFFAGTRTVDGARRRDRWRWPVFLLGCPDAADAALEAGFTTESTRSSSWSLELFGAGLERKGNVSVSDSFRVRAEPGQHRLLFLEQDVDVVELEVRRGDRVIRSGQRLEIVPGRQSVGVIDLPALPSWASVARPPMTVLDFRGAAATPAQEWARQETRSSEYSLVLGGDLAPVKLGATLGYQLTTTVALEARLPGGHGWEVARPAECAGVIVAASDAATGAR
jgi:hypothetical protein